jgi:L-ascorbate metabolism protein UlaG (beta-lactamase superfamily)
MINTTSRAEDNRRRLTNPYVGGPTALLELCGIRLLTDPTFAPPGEHPVGSRVSIETSGPAVPPNALGPVDAVLLSHDQHPDNLDTLGRELVATVPLMLSTAAARDRTHGPVRALPNWEAIELPTSDDRALRVTGAPAQHGLHFEGWTHFTRGRDTLVTAFERAGLSDRLRLPEPGESIDL